MRRSWLHWVGIAALGLLMGCYQHHELETDGSVPVPSPAPDADMPPPPPVDAGPEPEPEPPPPNTRAVALAAGMQHVCALTDRGQVYCWGANDIGQIGRVRPSALTTPTRVLGLPTIVQIDAGSAHTCGLDEEGGIWCWGFSTYGQLGARPEALGTDCPGGAECRTRPVPLMTPAVDVVYADQHNTAARMRNGGLEGWGQRMPRGLPRPDVLFVRDYGRGVQHGCLLTDEAQVRCFGETEFGRTGDAGRGDGVVELAEVVEVEVGTDHTCALDGESRVFCWGYNWSGNLGRPKVDLPYCIEGDTGGECAEGPIRPSGSPFAVALSVGGHRTCILNEEGEVRCWGPWQINRSTTRCDISPEDCNDVPTLVEGLDAPIAIEAGASVNCAIEADGGVRCWGSNTAGQLGIGTRSRELIEQAQPVVGFGG